MTLSPKNEMAHVVTKQRGWLSFIERGLIISGVTLLCFYAIARTHSMITFHAALRSLEANQRAEAATAPVVANRLLPADSSPEADESLWSEERIRAYHRSTVARPGTPLAVLRIPKMQLEVPVLEGTDRLTLNSGVGRIAGTAFPGQPGNVGIAGHRDGFFRGLKDIGTGDTIQLVTSQWTGTYIVDDIHITIPEDLSVLRPSAQPQITLVTCYPFYFIGPAPKRYIVRASLKQQTATSAPSKP
jgi:sortase A